MINKFVSQFKEELTNLEKKFNDKFKSIKKNINNNKEKNNDIKEEKDKEHLNEEVYQLIQIKISSTKKI